MTLGFKQQINGHPTYFIEKIWRSLPFSLQSDNYLKFNSSYHDKFNVEFDKPWNDTPDGAGLHKYPVAVTAKAHTIREDKSNRWQPGKLIHPVINNRTANRFQFAPILECISVQTINIRWKHKGSQSWVFVKIDGKNNYGVLHQLAPNDGFDSIKDFLAYFNKDFTGKIIHWTNLKY